MLIGYDHAGPGTVTRSVCLACREVTNRPTHLRSGDRWIKVPRSQCAPFISLSAVWNQSIKTKERSSTSQRDGVSSAQLKSTVCKPTRNFMNALGVSEGWLSCFHSTSSAASTAWTQLWNPLTGTSGLLGFFDFGWRIQEVVGGFMRKTCACQTRKHFKITR